VLNAEESTYLPIIASGEVADMVGRWLHRPSHHGHM